MILLVLDDNYFFYLEFHQLELCTNLNPQTVSSILIFSLKILKLNYLSCSWPKLPFLFISVMIL